MIATTTAKGAGQLAELHDTLEMMIHEHGYRKTLRSLDAAWDAGRCSWQVYAQMRNVARNVNANLKRLAR